MQTSTTRKDLELEATIPENGRSRRIQMPERRTVIAAAAITGGAIGAGLVMYYYLRSRRRSGY